MRREWSARVAWQVVLKAAAPPYGDEVLHQGMVASLLVSRRTDVFCSGPHSFNHPFAFENIGSTPRPRLMGIYCVPSYMDEEHLSMSPWVRFGERARG